MCQAIYRLVDLFPQNEFLGRQIKELANVLTADVLTIERIGAKIPLNIAAASVKSLFDDLILSIVRNSDKMIGYLEIAKGRGWLKPINFDILIGEYQKLSSFLQSRESARAPKADSSIIDFPLVRAQENDCPLPPLPDRPSIFVKKPKPIPLRQNFNKGLNSRQKKIMDFMRKNGEAKMANFSGIFGNEVTERTLRNDLRALVGAGAIRSEGEFKTRKYYI